MGLGESEGQGAVGRWNEVDESVCYEMCDV